jgi:hypothetical protein
MLAVVDPALGHLPGLVGIIDAGADEDFPFSIEQHHADSAAVEMIVVGHA